MRNYQRTKNNPYQLPHNVYYRCLYAVRDYDRIRKELDALIDSSPSPPDGQPRGTDTSNPTADKAVKCAMLSCGCEAIEQSIAIVPLEYRKGIMNSIIYGSSYPIDAHRNTYSYWKVRFLYQVAKKSYLI